MAQSDAFFDELVRISGDLDRLIAERQVGRPSQTRHDGHVDQAGALAKRLHEAGRGPGRPTSPRTAERPVHPPIARTAHGFAW